ncbi:hypothetical protein DKX38_022675 [Salix brachista]|uniref:Uncharacterized protein n=1 Tax=Salix brachista TaxID=2182728 RepID=A0A5N5K1Z4_9ROSI|nr:hypothetical protein DKX38_022675 [Salix brachista]
MERGEGTGNWREEAAVVVYRQERVEGRRRGVMVWKGREEGRIIMVALIIRGRLKVMRKCTVVLSPLEHYTLRDKSRLDNTHEMLYTPAERVKARMKLQLNETDNIQLHFYAAKKDEGMGSGWERFEFNKDAPLDDEEVEAVEDDAALVKHIGQSFRFSAVEARREEQIKTAHDDAMFGAPSLLASVASDNEIEMDNNRIESHDTDHASSLLNEKVLAKQQGSWRDRARKI